MRTTLLGRSRLVLTAFATVGLVLGVLVALVFTGRGERFTAQATLAMLPAPEIPAAESLNYWEVLNRGQATRSAAIVLGDGRWLDAAASAASVPKSELTISAGAVPNTTLIDVTMQANSAHAAEVALDSVLKNAVGYAATVSGPFRLEVTAAPVGSARSTSPGRLEALGTLGIAGLLLGGGAGLLISRSAQRRAARLPGPLAAPAELRPRRRQNGDVLNDKRFERSSLDIPS